MRDFAYNLLDFLYFVGNIKIFVSRTNGIYKMNIVIVLVQNIKKPEKRILELPKTHLSGFLIILGKLLKNNEIRIISCEYP